MKQLYIILGVVCVVLAIIGIVVPLLPTTPLLLLAAWLWTRSSPWLYNKLIDSPLLGRYIRDFRENRAIPLRAKITSVVLVWISLLYCALVVVKQLWVSVLLVVLMLAISAHILSFKTLCRK